MILKPAANFSENVEKINWLCSDDYLQREGEKTNQFCMSSCRGYVHVYVYAYANVYVDVYVYAHVYVYVHVDVCAYLRIY